MNILKKVENFSKSISGKIFANYNLKKLSWFGLGGSADIFFKPNTLNELVLFLKQFGHILPLKVIGGGSNILIRDGGFKGTIIKFVAEAILSNLSAHKPTIKPTAPKIKEPRNVKIKI